MAPAHPHVTLVAVYPALFRYTLTMFFFANRQSFFYCLLTTVFYGKLTKICVFNQQCLILKYVVSVVFISFPFFYTVKNLLINNEKNGKNLLINNEKYLLINKKEFFIFNILKLKIHI